jgi:hypothetical protein
MIEPKLIKSGLQFSSNWYKKNQEWNNFHNFSNFQNIVGIVTKMAISAISQWESIENSIEKQLINCLKC